MQKIARTIAGLLSVGFLTSCTLAFEGRNVAAVTGSRGLTNSRIDYAQVERLLDGIAQSLKTAGYKPSPYHHLDPFDQPDPNHPYTYNEGVTGERSYGARFESDTGVYCSIEFNRTRVHVIFSELADPSGSHRYRATAQERQAAGILAQRIATYLQANLPPYYKVAVSFARQSA